MFLVAYLNIMLFFILSFLLSTLVLVLSLLVSSKSDDVQKLSAYECGFNPFDDSRNEFNVKFYLVAILFIIFDLEISFLFPFVTSFVFLDLIGLVTILLFLIILTIGFVFEWQKGALDWS